jgi:hypothetical protein
MPASTMFELRNAWSTEQANRANGGWWALSGFTFQMLVGLSGFLKRSLADDDSGEMGIEELSDILEQRDDGYRLSQVKRTLKNESLSSAIGEAYEIVKLSAPSLRTRLTFQIVCQSNQSTRAVSAHGPSHVFKDDNYDAAIFAETLKLFDRQEPIVVAAHPSSMLLQMLWNAGVDNPAGVLAEALGRIFATFDGQNREKVREGVFEALDIIQRARSKSRVIGRLLTSTDFRISAPNGDEPVRLSWRPRLEDLTLGRFLSRDSQLGAVEQSAVNWLRDVPKLLTDRTNRLPVFWIDGRAGDGKSVALLQLASKLVSSERLASLTELQDVEELKTWIESRPKVSAISDEQPIDVAFIDDLPSCAGIEVIEDIVAKALYRGDRACALLTCGPTSTVEPFRTSQPFRIETTRLQPPDALEFEAFRQWIEDRTKSSFSDIPSSNSSLAQWLYGLGKRQQSRLPMQRNLETSGLFGKARNAAALNACGIAAPVDLFDPGELQQLEALVSEGSHGVALSLDISKDGVRLGHSEVVLPLYMDWLGKDRLEAMKQDFCNGLVELLRVGDNRSARRLVGQLLDPKFLKERLSIKEAEAATTLLDAMFKATKDVDFAARITLIPLWLNAGRSKRLSVQGLEEAKEDAGALLEQRSTIAAMKADLATALYRATKDGTRLRSIAEKAIVEGSQPSIIAFLKRRCEKAVIGEEDALVQSWLHRHRKEASAFPLVSALLSRQREHVVNVACDLIDSFPALPESGELLWTINEQKLKCPRYFALLNKWLDAAPSGAVAARLYARQLQGRRGNDYVTRALRWVTKNLNVPGVHDVLAALVARAPGDDEVEEIVQIWLDSEPPLSEANPVLVALMQTVQHNTLGLHTALSRLDIGPRDNAWSFLFHKSSNKVRDLSPSERETLKLGLGRGPLNVMDQIMRSADRAK